MVFVDGTNRDVGLREVLTRAHEVRAVAIEPGFVNVAVFRLLLAVVLDAFGPPVDEDDFVRLACLRRARDLGHRLRA